MGYWDIFQKTSQSPDLNPVMKLSIPGEETPFDLVMSMGSTLYYRLPSLTAKYFHPNIKNILIFIVLFVCLIIIGPLKMG